MGFFPFNKKPGANRQTNVHGIETSLYSVVSTLLAAQARQMMTLCRVC